MKKYLADPLIHDVTVLNCILKICVLISDDQQVGSADALADDTASDDSFLASPMTVYTLIGALALAVAIGACCKWGKFLFSFT